MNYRFTFAFVALAAALAFGLFLNPVQAAAATPVELSPAEQTTLSAALVLTKASLDATQAQLAVNPNAIQDPAMAVAALNGIRDRLVAIQSLLVNGTLPVASRPSASQAPAAESSRPGNAASQATPAPEAPEAAVEPTPATQAGEQPNQETASVSSSASSKVFWGVLIAAAILAAILALPKRKAPVLSSDRPVAAAGTGATTGAPTASSGTTEEPRTAQST